MTGAPCQLYLTLPASGDMVGADLSRCLSTSEFACVLFNTATPELVRIAQEAGVAALISADAALAQTIGADGVHLPAQPDLLQAYRDARARLGNEAIVGIHAGNSRHDALSAAEDGADYVAFDFTSPGQFGDKADARHGESGESLIGWWAELVEVPCVAWGVETAGEAGDARRIGADFIALSDNVWQRPHDIDSTIATFAAAIAPAGD